MSKLPLTPLADFIITEETAVEEKTQSGLYIPETAQEKPLVATVLAVGEGVFNADGKRIPVEVKAGDKVLHYAHSGAVLKHNGVEYRIFRPQDILAIVND